MARKNYRNPEGPGQKLSISFDVSDSVYAQIHCIAEDREWTVSHVLRKIIPLGLDVYLRGTALPSLVELTGVPAPDQEVSGND